MSELVADCPRCGSQKITFDLTQQNLIGVQYDWQRWYEAFCICRHCRRATVFVLSQNTSSNKSVVHEKGLIGLTSAVNRFMNVEHYISLKDADTVPPPEFLPKDIEAAFTEGAKCLAIGCINAAATMFRLCVDFASKAQLPESETEGLNGNIRRNLGLRLPWLFDNGLLPEALRELSSCIKEDGNDGAHAGTLTKHDAEDLLDFTVALLERMYTEPERLRIAQERRNSRRNTDK